MTEPKLNKRLLRKVRNRIAKIPESYDQNHFWLDSSNAPCGTVACLAGETIIVSRPTVKQGLQSLRRLTNSVFCVTADHPVARRAASLLGVSDAEAVAMFDGDGERWPQPYRAQFERAGGPQTRAKVAVAYLDECLKRGKVIW